jgi:serine/threonine protein kinase
MPRLTSSLADLKPLTKDAQTSYCHDTISAVEYLHRLNVAHMDIKPANIGITWDGRFVRIDIGNAAKFGELIDVTDAFVPLDFTIRGGLPARADVDFGLIATALLSKLAPSMPPRMHLVVVIDSLRVLNCAESVTG